MNGVTPTTYILTPTGKVIGTPIEGAVDSDILFGLLKGLEDYKKGQLVFSMEKNIEKLILEAYEDSKTKVEHVTTYQSIFEKKT
ncbi:putative thioredoxin [Campylobacter jejuni subsp. doylei]|nr:putative thioredoxin [Campylobacter jejuni subsp. doylei]